MKYFIKPSGKIYSSPEFNYIKGSNTYAEYNYLKSGISSYIKLKHFETALKMTKKYFHKYNVIDFGCADGVFLPSLANYFNHVIGIDINPGFIDIASKMLDETGLRNLQLICNREKSIDQIRNEIIKREYSILFLLEVIEHIGDKNSPWESRIDFLKKISALIEKRGIIILTTPKMIGLSFLLQQSGLTLFKLSRENISFKNLLKAGLLKNTEDLEKIWDGGHLGFNHKKLERYLFKEFRLLKKKELLFQTAYMFQKIE